MSYSSWNPSVYSLTEKWDGTQLPFCCKKWTSSQTWATSRRIGSKTRLWNRSRLIWMTPGLLFCCIYLFESFNSSASLLYMFMYFFSVHVFFLWSSPWQNVRFDLEAVEKVSAAAKSVCVYLQNVYKYSTMIKCLRPKQKRVEEITKDLENRYMMVTLSFHNGFETAFDLYILNEIFSLTVFAMTPFVQSERSRSQVAGAGWTKRVTWRENDPSWTQSGTD